MGGEVRPRPAIMLEIDGIEDISDRGVQVTIRATGKTAWLPIDDIDCLPGAVVIPEWLAKKFNLCGGEHAKGIH